MNTRKYPTRLILIIVLTLLLAACGRQQTETETQPADTATPLPAPVAASPTTPPTEPTTEAPVLEDSGYITGRAHMQAPPTPPLVVSAVDDTTGLWFFVETQQSDGETHFTLEVRPGSYQVFACIQEASACSLAYSEDGWSLGIITVAAGQTVENVMVRPPSQSECGATFGFPASPDGRFAAVPGPSEECKEAAMAGMEDDLRPLNAGECSDLAGAMSQVLGVVTETSETFIENSWSEQTGTACQIIATGSGLDFEHIIMIEDNLKAVLRTWGWYEETAAPICLGKGGWGPGASTSCFTQADQICEVFVYVEPVDHDLCPDDQPISVCFDTLAPEQLIYYRMLTCAHHYQAAGPTLPGTHPARIDFAPGAISAQIQDTLAAGGLHPYLLNAAAGQEMTVNLVTYIGGNPVSGSAILIIWGLDGTVLISDHADASSWTGVLPVTQDYFIDVRSVGPDAVDYTLEVVIPPAGESSVPAGLPQVIPPEFELYMQALALTGGPVMLPAEFPVEEGLPAVYPYIFTADEGEYEFSLDYGEEGQGTGACHYGSMSGKQIGGTEPVGTRTFPFDMNQARPLALANNIAGYFTESVCGANCNDATVYWIYNGFQYMVGLKGAPEAKVVELANAAIFNFEP